MASKTLPRVNVVGLGKLGAPLAAVLASRGFSVIGLDVNKVLVDALNAGREHTGQATFTATGQCS